MRRQRWRSERTRMGCRGSAEIRSPGASHSNVGLFRSERRRIRGIQVRAIVPGSGPRASPRQGQHGSAALSRPDHPGSAAPTRFPQPLPSPLSGVAPGAESRYAGVKVRGLVGLPFTRIARPSVCNPPPLPTQNAEDCSRITPRARGYSESVVGRRAHNAEKWDVSCGHGPSPYPGSR